MDNNHHIIIIEGLTGTGKSTLAHFLKRQLDYQGIPNDWVHEAELPHPILPTDDLQPEIFMEHLPQSWHDYLVRKKDAGQIAIVEAAFFNNLIEASFTQNVPRSRLLEFGMQLEEIIRPFRPALIYLHRTDISAALEHIFNTRGPGFEEFVIDYVENTPYAQANHYHGRSGTIRFWEDFWSILDELYTNYSIDKFTPQDPGIDWGHDNQEILDFLGIPYQPDPLISSSEAQPYLGEYQLEDSEDVWRIWHDPQAQQLRVNKNSLLIPISEHRFALSSLHFEILFKIGPDQQAVGFEIQGKDIDYMQLVGSIGRRLADTVK